MTVADLYDEYHRRKRGRTWSRSDYALGLLGDLGDLAKLVMIAEDIRDGTPDKSALEHELADCLWSVLVLAQRFDVDLETAFATTMDQLEVRVKGNIAAHRLRSETRSGVEQLGSSTGS